MTSPVSSGTRAPPRGTKAAIGPVSPGPEQLLAAPATTASGGAAEGETAAIAVPCGAQSAGKESGEARRGNPRRWIQPARQVLYVKAELLNLVKSAR